MLTGCDEFFGCLGYGITPPHNKITVFINSSILILPMVLIPLEIPLHPSRPGRAEPISRDP